MFDTNVVLDLLVFDDATARPLFAALSGAHVRCVISEATLEEWRRVLAYPEFKQDRARQKALFERYQALSVMQGAGLAPVDLPRCSDPDDQKFLELAVWANAQVLVSKDRALLKLRRRCAALFQIMSPAEAVHWLQAVGPGRTADT